MYSRPIVFTIGRLCEHLTRHRTALLCAEENPDRCHRRRLIAPGLCNRGIAVCHIRGDGRLEKSAENACGKAPSRQRVDICSIL